MISPAVSTLGKIAGTIAALRFGPALLQRLLDLLPYTASAIRSIPCAWQIAAIKGRADVRVAEISARTEVRIAEINAEGEILKAEQKGKKLREHSVQPAPLLTMPEKTG